MIVRLLFVLLVLLLTTTACAGGGGGGGAASKGTDYQVGLETQPSPMQSGRLATVTLRIKDPGGQPVSGAKVTFKGEHTGMGMGGGGTVDTQEREPGVYSGGFTPTMGGKYAVTVTVDGPRGRGEKTIDAEAQ